MHIESQKNFFPNPLPSVHHNIYIQANRDMTMMINQASESYPFPSIENKEEILKLKCIEI